MDGSGNAETVLGYSLFAGVVYLAVAVLRRTRDIDRRRDLLAQAERELAEARVMTANRDRDYLKGEIERLQEELWQIKFAQGYVRHDHRPGTPRETGEDRGNPGEDHSQPAE